MRRLRYILFLLLSCIIATSNAASRLFPDEHHFIAIWAHLGYPCLLTNYDQMKQDMSLAPAIGLGYRYFRNGFIIQTGLEGEFNYITNRINDSQLSIGMTDTEREAFTMHISATNGKDYMQFINCYVPLYVGYEYRHFYLLAGAEVGMNLYGTTYTTSTLSTKAEYERYLGWLEDMPNHDLRNNVPVSSTKYKLKLSSPSVQAHLEIGGRLDRFSTEKGADVVQKKYRLYLAAFADYGIMNIHQQESEGDLISFSQTSGEALQFNVTPAMLSSQMLNHQVHPLTIGIKFTCLFELPGKKICVMCRE